MKDREDVTGPPGGWPAIPRSHRHCKVIPAIRPLAADLDFLNLAGGFQTNSLERRLEVRRESISAPHGRLSWNQEHYILRH